MAKPNITASLMVTASLIPIVYFTVYEVLATNNFTNDMKAMVVGTVIGALLGTITGFWLGGTNDKNGNPPTPPTA